MDLKRYGKAAALALTVTYAHVALGGVSVGSFNIQHLGWGEQKDYAIVAQIAGAFDILAVQEVMNEEGAQRLHQALEHVTGEPWSFMMSHLIGRGSYKEAYAIYSRDATAQYKDGAVVYLDPSDTFAREPFSARYRSLATGNVYALANIHVLYGERVSDRLPEINYLSSYWQWLEEIYPETPIILAGDFNLDADHDAFTELLATSAKLAVTDQQGTTISPINGRYANDYDHIFVSHDVNVTSSGVLRFPQLLDMPHEEARATVSDHVPVWIGLNGAGIQWLDNPDRDLSLEPPCIDINQSGKSELIRLPHIGEARAKLVKEGRPWEGVEGLQAIRGLGEARIADIISSRYLCQ